MGFQIFICNPWEFFMSHMEITSHQAQIKHDLDLERETELNLPIEEIDVQYLDIVFCYDHGVINEAS